MAWHPLADRLANRMDAIHAWRWTQGLDDWFHPNHTRMGPAHFINHNPHGRLPGPESVLPTFRRTTPWCTAEYVQASGPACIAALC